MIQFKYNIENISKYQCGNLPKNSIKLKTPATEEIQKKAFPIAVVLCAVMFIAMFFKTFINHMSVIEPIFILVGVILGFLLLFIHEILHAVVYPKSANVTIGNLKNKIFFVALASYPLKRSRFIFMSLLPLVLGIVPLLIFSSLACFEQYYVRNSLFWNDISLSRYLQCNYCFETNQKA